MPNFVNVNPSTDVQSPKDCQAKRIFLSGKREVSLKTSVKASCSTSVRVFVFLIMSLASILVESSKDKITLGATYGSTVPGGELAKSSAQALAGAKAALAAIAIRRRRNFWGVVRRGMVNSWGGTKEQKEKIKNVGKTYKYPNMVFTSTTGDYKDRSRLNLQFKRFIKDTDFCNISLHKLRHANATLLINAGVDLKLVSENLGHSDVSVTANIYSEVLESSKKKMADLVALNLK